MFVFFQKEPKAIGLCWQMDGNVLWLLGPAWQEAAVFCLRSPLQVSGIPEIRFSFLP